VIIRIVERRRRGERFAKEIEFNKSADGLLKRGVLAVDPGVKVSDLIPFPVSPSCESLV